MIKRLTLLAAAALSCTGLAAQGLNLKVNVGYAVPTTGDVLGTRTTYNDGGTLASTTNIYGTLGGGLRLGAGLGYLFSEYIGIELNAEYMIGNPTEVTEYAGPGPNNTLLATAQSTQLRLNPTIIVQSSMLKKAVYARMGLLLPVMGKTVVEVDQSTEILGVVHTYHTITEAKGAMSLGYNGALGVSLPILDHFDIYAEVQGAYLKVKSASSEIVKSIVDGGDVLPTMDTYYTQTTFVDELSTGSNHPSYTTNLDLTKPREDLATKSPYSSIGANVGFRLRF